MQPARDRTGPSSGQGDRWAHLCFLLLGSGSGDWAAGGKVATPEKPSDPGCQRPWAITKNLLQPCLATSTAHYCQRAWTAFFPLLVAQISVVRLTTLLHQRPMNGRIDKVGGSASLPVCQSVLQSLLARKPLTLGGSVGSVPARVFSIHAMPRSRQRNRPDLPSLIPHPSVA